MFVSFDTLQVVVHELISWNLLETESPLNVKNLAHGNLGQVEETLSYKPP